MFKKIGLAAVLFVAACLVAGFAMAQETTEQAVAPATEATTMATPAVTAPVNVGNKVCPVTGEKVSGADTVEYEGKVYNLCCPMCKDEFLKNPEKYIAKVNEELSEEKTETPGQEKAESVEKGTTQKESMPEHEHMHEGM